MCGSNANVKLRTKKKIIIYSDRYGNDTSDTNILRHLYNIPPVVIIHLYDGYYTQRQCSCAKTSQRLTCRKIRIVHLSGFQLLFQFPRRVVKTKSGRTPIRRASVVWLKKYLSDRNIILLLLYLYTFRIKSIVTMLRDAHQ